MTLTSTYDHRIIQGAQSGDFLRIVHGLLLGDDDFYDEIFRALRIPYEPIRWAADVPTSHEDQIGKQARVLELIHAYRVRGHLMADTDPLEYKQRSHPDLDVTTHGLTLWDLDREFATGSFGGAKPFMLLRDILGVLRNAYCRTVGIEYMHIQEPDQRQWIQHRVERKHEKMDREDQLRILHKLNQAEAFETFLQTKYVGQKRFSLEGGESTISLLDEICEAAAEAKLDEVCIGMAHRGRLNVLANIVGKSYGQIFREFEGNIDPRTVHHDPGRRPGPVDRGRRERPADVRTQRPRMGRLRPQFVPPGDAHHGRILRPVARRDRHERLVHRRRRSDRRRPRRRHDLGDRRVLGTRRGLLAGRLAGHRLHLDRRRHPGTQAKR